MTASATSWVRARGSAAALLLLPAAAWSLLLAADGAASVAFLRLSGWLLMLYTFVGAVSGVIRRMSYLDSLNIDAVWLDPVYPSPMKARTQQHPPRFFPLLSPTTRHPRCFQRTIIQAYIGCLLTDTSYPQDFGYDVADFRSVDPTFGTLSVLRTLIRELHRRGIRAVMDLVPNHTSDRARPGISLSLTGGGDASLRAACPPARRVRRAPPCPATTPNASSFCCRRGAARCHAPLVQSIRGSGTAGRASGRRSATGARTHNWPHRRRRRLPHWANKCPSCARLLPLLSAAPTIYV